MKLQPQARLGTPTYPKDEIEDEKQIFHTFHPALHFAHGSAGIVAITADISSVIKIFAISRRS